MNYKRFSLCMVVASDNIFSLMCKVANSCNFILLPFY
jgi:hypothetical protein